MLTKRDLFHTVTGRYVLSMFGLGVLRAKIGNFSHWTPRQLDMVNTLDIWKLVDDPYGPGKIWVASGQHEDVDMLIEVMGDRVYGFKKIQNNIQDQYGVEVSKLALANMIDLASKYGLIIRLV